MQVVQIQHQIVEPERGALAHRHHLRRLQVRIAQRRQCLVFQRKVTQIFHHAAELPSHQRQRVLEDNHIGVVPHVAGGGAEMNDRARLGALLAPRVDVRHHVMAQFFLIRRRLVIVHVGGVGAQFVQLLVRDVQPRLLFRFGKGDPERAPGGEFFIRGKEILHLPGGVSGGKG